MASNAFKRHGVYWVELDPARGRELRKTRPGVIVSRDELNDAIDTVVVCPLAGTLHPSWPTRLQIKIAGKETEIAVDQIRVVSKERLKGRLGELTSGQAARLREILHSTYAD
ncbi:MAG: type II toxin-antitoxin system PemK/MazF family toxin [Opitutus sp.]|nr:type II toxin-antitoxin system PemK/MazF family toxin [Opitutus sp.]